MKYDIKEIEAKLERGEMLTDAESKWYRKETAPRKVSKQLYYTLLQGSVKFLS